SARTGPPVPERRRRGTRARARACTATLPFLSIGSPPVEGRKVGGGPLTRRERPRPPPPAGQARPPTGPRPAPPGSSPRPPRVAPVGLIVRHAPRDPLTFHPPALDRRLGLHLPPAVGPAPGGGRGTPSLRTRSL